MIQTAIIAFIFIGAMFIFTGCGDSSAEEVTKVEVEKEGSLGYVTAKSHDNSYSERDKEMAMASYKREEKESNSTIHYRDNDIKYNLARKERPHKTDTFSAQRDDEMVLASYAVTNMLDEEVVLAETALVITPEVAVAKTTVVAVPDENLSEEENDSSVAVVEVVEAIVPVVPVVSEVEVPEVVEVIAPVEVLEENLSTEEANLSIKKEENLQLF